MKRELILAIVCAVIMLGALILGRTMQEILNVFLGIILLWLLFSRKDEGGRDV